MKVNFKEMMFDEVAIFYKQGDETSDYTRGMGIPDQVSN
jgi:hypothetical protein